MKTIIKRWICVVMALFPAHTYANNLTISNVALGEVAGGHAEITFDLTWENSWRASWQEFGGALSLENWDAAWVFVKFRAGGGQWQHALLATEGHTPAAGTVIEPAGNDGSHALGAFVYRAVEGSGTLQAQGVKLRWDYTASGLGGTHAVDISVHGIEMVYIPEGSFKVGSGGTEEAAFYRYPDQQTPYTVASEEEIPVGPDEGSLYYNSYSGAGDRAGPIPAEFPKGYQSFYAMKYEVTQGQYTEFLNKLEPGMASARFPNQWDRNGHRISVTDGVYWTDTPDRACNYLNREHAAMYLDWAALRPMTELEFEKLCRGPLDPVPNEYAWGDTIATHLSGFEGVEGSGIETATPVNANSHFRGWWNQNRPVRVGIFARDATTRQQAGAGYFGNMELSGNVMERVVSAGHPEGRTFDGSHGDGNPYTMIHTWSSSLTWEGMRGGAFAHVAGSMHSPSYTYHNWPISDRRYAAQDFSSIFAGVRGVRTAP